MQTNRPPFGSGVEDPESVIRFARLVGAAVLLVFGVVVAGWVIYSVLNVFVAAESPALVEAVLPVGEGEASLTTPEGEFVIPTAAFRVAGYLIVCFVLAIAAGVAGMLISQGVNLLQPGLGEILRKVYWHMSSDDR